MALRYMGTKRHLAPAVRETILATTSDGPVLDLFSGLGSVAQALAPDLPVMVNDFLGFTGTFARARFLDLQFTPSEHATRLLLPPYLEHRAFLRDVFSQRLASEQQALAETPEQLADWFRTAPHTGRSDHYRREARKASRSTGAIRYQLITRYYSAGFFSTQQAIDLDAIRLAIDTSRMVRPRSWLLAAWLHAASSIINAPGHTAQFLKPTTGDAVDRIRRYWRRSAWEAFSTALQSIGPIGTRQWRARNQVRTSEALKLLGRLRPGDVAAIYADPPYTRDQYHRFYHVYETMYRYDFPMSRGAGRTPEPAAMNMSVFSRVTSVRDAFESLFIAVARLGCPLVLSYPSNGLLVAREEHPEQIAHPWLRVVEHMRLDHRHSTLGASSGDKTKSAEENIYVFRAS